jgi:chemotaxis protein MotB
MLPKSDKPAVKQNTMGWMTTYTDLMTLLLTFFVLLLSLSIIDNRKKRLALNSLVGAFGFKPGGHSVMGSEKGENVTVGAAPIAKEQIDFEQLQNIAFKNGLENDVSITREAERIIINIGNRVLFEDRSFHLEEDGLRFLSEMATVLKDAPGRIELRGYADPTETNLESDPLRAGMLLSTKRAFAVYHFLHSDGKIPFPKMVSHGFGSQPLRRSTQQIGKPLNRQVEIICDYRIKIPYHLKNKRSLKSILLDFKGFLFNLERRSGG